MILSNLSHKPWPAALRMLPALLVLAGCASPGKLPTPLAALQPAAAGLQADAATEFPQAAWWQALGDARLNALIDQALAGAPSLQVAAARLARASAGVEVQQAAQGPQAGFDTELTRQHFTAKGLYPPPLAGHVYNTGNVQTTGSIELDFFGKHQAALAAALGQRQAAAADLQAARVLLAANVARGYVALGRMVSLREVLQRSLAQRQSLLDLTRQRVQAGLDTQVELRLSELTVPDVRQQIEALDGQIVLQRHQLAVLCGQAPQALDGLSPQLGSLAAGPVPQRLGADLLGRRADVVAARWRVEASAQDVALARTQFYPDVNLVGFFGLNAIGLDHLLSLPSRNFGAGPAVRLPLFDGGRLRGNLKGKAAEADAAVAAYNAAVLDAAREVADAAALLQSLARQQAEQVQAQAGAEAAYQLAQQRFGAGLGTQLTVLSAETAVLAQRSAGLDLKARALDTQVALMRALGGGWSGEGLTTPTAVATTATR